MQERIVCVTLEDLEEGYDARYVSSYIGFVNSLKDINNYMNSIGFVRHFTKSAGRSNIYKYSIYGLFFKP